MKSVVLADACDVVTDGTHYTPRDIGSGVPFLTVKDVGPSGLDFEGCARISEDDYATADAGTSAPKRGDVLFSKDGTVGKVHVVETDERFAVLSSLAILRPAASVDSKYLGHMLRTPNVLAQAVRRKSGSAIRRIILSDLKKVEIPLPPLPDQRCIAAILDQADALRAKRREVLAHLDDLSRSIFLEMFGDPLANNLGFDRFAVGSVAPVVTGNSPSRADSANFGDEIEWIKSDNLGDTIATKAQEGLSPQGRRKARTAPPGSVLVTCIAGSPASIGKASMVDREVAFNQQINAVLPSDRLDTTFLLAQFKAAPGLVRSKSTGGMKGLVSKTAFQSIDILLPSLGLQREFAVRAERVGCQRAAVSRAVAADNALCSSLQSRAFRGEL